jgi:hypothetical protein
MPLPPLLTDVDEPEAERNHRDCTKRAGHASA